MNRQKIYIAICTLMLALLSAGCALDDKRTDDLMYDEDKNGEMILSEEVFDTNEEEVFATGVSFDIPTGMKEDADIPGYYVSENYANDYASVFYQEAAYDDRYSLLTEGTIVELMQSMYLETYGIETVIEVKDFHRFNLDGYEAYYLEVGYTIGDIVIESIEYAVISGEKVYSVTYAQKQNGGWKIKYEQSAGNLHVR